MTTVKNKPTNRNWPSDNLQQVNVRFSPREIAQLEELKDWLEGFTGMPSSKGKAIRYILAEHARRGKVQA